MNSLQMLMGRCYQYFVSVDCKKQEIIGRGAGRMHVTLHYRSVIKLNISHLSGEVVVHAWLMLFDQFVF